MVELGRSIDEIEIGDTASVERTFTLEEVEEFARLTWDESPHHVDDEYARQSRFGRRTVHGMLTTSLVSVLASRMLPGPGTIGIDLYTKLTAPVYIGDTIIATCEVVEKDEEKNRIKVKLIFVNQDGKTVLIGESRCCPPVKTK